MRWASRCTRDIAASARRPTDEDRHWFPDIAGTRLAARRWISRCATSRTRASSPSTCRPKLMRDLRLFADASTTRTRSELEVAAIHDEAGYRRVRQALSRPVQPRQARAQHPGLERRPARRPLADAAPHPAQRPAAGRRRAEVLKHVARLWGFRGAPGERRRRGRRHQALGGPARRRPEMVARTRAPHTRATAATFARERRGA